MLRRPLLPASPPPPVVLDIDDTRAPEDLRVEILCIGAGELLDLADAWNARARKCIRQILRAKEMHLVG